MSNCFPLLEQLTIHFMWSALELKKFLYIIRRNSDYRGERFRKQISSRNQFFLCHFLNLLQKNVFLILFRSCPYLIVFKISELFKCCPKALFVLFPSLSPSYLSFMLEPLFLYTGPVQLHIVVCITSTDRIDSKEAS